MARRKRRKKKGFWGRNFDIWDALVLIILVVAGIIVFYNSGTIWNFIVEISSIIFASTLIFLIVRHAFQRARR